jgi:hypothetical protein
LDVYACDLECKWVHLIFHIFVATLLPTHARLSPPQKRVFSLFNREKGARGGNGGGEERDKNGQ